jgi:predicted dehydrogenase/threonine dehydrogenase-like Zn-dependent dehydrogenase
LKQVLIKEGKVETVEVPPPIVTPGNLLVSVDHSCISAGTEMSGLRTSAQPLWKRAIKNPKAVKNTLKMVAEKGFTHTKSVVEGKLTSGYPTGYSAAGIVLEVGTDIDDIRPGDRVACAGAKYANHAEVICVPRNLSVKIPHDLELNLASTVTLGAIALQGVRRANPTIGETFVVMGLGILGQITAQILKLNGCRVVGTDLISSRIQLAKQQGMEYGISPAEENPIDSVLQLTNGQGADGVIITASTSSSELVSTAFNMCRKKGRVVVVGDVGLDLDRGDFYPKEIDFLISSSYGPGRYDNNYEEKGNDYPLGYVRWTENRNMEEYLRMIAEGKLHIDHLINSTFELNNADQAYASLKKENEPPLIVLLSYPTSHDERLKNRTIENPMAKGAGKNQIRLGLIGAGGFAKGMHLPLIQENKAKFYLAMVSSKTGHNSMATAKQFGADRSTTNNEELINDKNIDAVIITTRHNLHSDLTCQALCKGKHVFVEKPLALNQKELETIKSIYQTNSNETDLPILLTGFNRRFSPYATRIKELIQDRANPIIINYTMNAGFIPLDHWTQTEEGGGRNLGEACHIYDLFTYLIDSQTTSIKARSISTHSSKYSDRDNFIATIKFSDGSLANLTYTAMGSNKYPKERLEIFYEGKVVIMNDYKQLTVAGLKGNDFSTSSVDKGHKNMLESFGEVIQSGGEWPIPFWQQVQATEIAINVEEQLLAKK